ncbi:MAG: hypothetical protein ABSA75_10475 [Candidatus Bathyarchaeia archaeon]
MDRASKVKFAKHAAEKFNMLKRYGFEIEQKLVVETVLQPERLDERGGQFLATKVISRRHALRVVYESRKDFLVVITFYPVRRERYDL